MNVLYGDFSFSDDDGDGAAFQPVVPTDVNDEPGDDANYGEEHEDMWRDYYGTRDDSD